MASQFLPRLESPVAFGSGYEHHGADDTVDTTPTPFDFSTCSTPENTNKRSFGEREIDVDAWFTAAGACTDGNSTSDETPSPSPKFTRFETERPLLGEEEALGTGAFSFELFDGEVSTALSSSEFELDSAHRRSTSLESITLLSEHTQQLQQQQAQVSASTEEPAVRPVRPKRHYVKKRDAAALARCREHSARARERRRAERAALNRTVATKTAEAERLATRLQALEQEVNSLKHFLAENAMRKQTEALVTPSKETMVMALAAMAQLHAMSSYEQLALLPQPPPVKRECGALAPICPRPITMSVPMHMPHAPTPPATNPESESETQQKGKEGGQSESPEKVVIELD